MKTYVTFGRDHTHHINGKTIDHNCVAVINGNRDDVFKMFGPKFCFEYSENEWNDSYDGGNADAVMKQYYPRGYINV